MINPVIIIPAYNPPDTFTKLVINIRKITSIPIIIIDDGSNEKIYLETSINNIHLIRNKYNLGKGASLLNSFNYAHKYKYSHCITIDADNQHDPLLIDSFLNIQSSIELVCGNRTFNFPMPLHRRISNILTSMVCSVITGTNILDSPLSNLYLNPVSSGYTQSSLESLASPSPTFVQRLFQHPPLSQQGKEPLLDKNL